MSKRRLPMLIVLCALIAVSGERIIEPIEGPVVLVEEPDIPWSELIDGYKEQLLFEIRKEHLVATTGIKEELASRIITAISVESLRYSLDPNRILALVIIESWGNPNAESRVGALGLMQVMPDTGRYIARKRGFRWSGVEELRVVESNISYGTWYYDHLLEMFDGDEHAAVSAYNWGPVHIRGRMVRGKDLPKVYPGKVYAAQEELQGVIRNEYQSRFRRGVDQYVSNTRKRKYAARSTSGSGHCQLPSSDGESVCVRDGESVPASTGDLSR